MSHRVALIVGISQYDRQKTGLDCLKAPANDANTIYRLLQTYSNFDLIPLPRTVNNIDGNNSYGISAVSPLSADELRTQITTVFTQNKETAPTDVLFYFSGHGIREEAGLSKNTSSYLATSDNKHAIEFSELSTLIKDSAVSNVIIILDCCHSGEIYTFFAKLQEKAICLIAACYAETEALAVDGKSLLTTILLEGLNPEKRNLEVINTARLVEFIHAYPNKPPQIIPPSGVSFKFIELTRQKNSQPQVEIPRYEGVPYKGLRAFEEKDAIIFFGRDKLIGTLLEKLTHCRFIAVLGASGNGKSSLVKAGLLPKLRQGHIHGKAWHILQMHPARMPLLNLRDALVRGFPDANIGALQTAQELQAEIKNHAMDKAVLLVIDQFEEVFTQCKEDKYRAAFFACLLDAVDSDNSLHLVITLRADFLGKCAEQDYHGLAQRINANSLLLTPLNADELRSVITQPLARVGMKMEAALVDTLVDESLREKGSLPLLQYALEKLWQAAKNSTLTLQQYQHLCGEDAKQSGLRGLLNQKATAFYTSLSPERQRLVEWLFVELTQLGEGQEDTRKTLREAELLQRHVERRIDIAALLEDLKSKERLLTGDTNEQQQATVTVAHEALIRNWDKLRGWLDVNRELKRWRERLEGDLCDWEQTQSSEYLLVGERLAEAQKKLKQYQDSLLIGERERKFIQASHEKEQSSTNWFNKELKKISSKYLKLIFSITIVFIFIVILQLYNFKQLTETSEHCQFQLDTILSTKFPDGVNGKFDRTLLLVAQAFKEQSNVETQSTLLHVVSSANRNDHKITAYLHHSASVTSIAFSPDSKMLASGSGKTVMLWDVVTHQPLGSPLQGHGSDITSVAFSADGKMLASGSADKTVILWEVATQKPLGSPLQGHRDMVSSVAFSADGKTLASADGTIILWDVVTHQPLGSPLQGHSDQVRSVAFSADGKTLASGSADKTAILWDVATHQPLGAPLQEHSDSVESVAFSADGETLASGSADGTVILWDVTMWEPLGWPLQGHNDSVWSVAFSADGKTLASGSTDKTVILWEVATQKPLGSPLQGHRDNVSSVAFSADGKTLASGSADGTVILWNIDPQSWYQRACRIANRNLTQKEWQRYLPGKPYQKTCPQFPSGEALALIAKGEQLAAEAEPKDMEAAIAKFNEAFALDPMLKEQPFYNFNPEAKAKKVAASASVSKGESLAQEEKLDEAIAAFKRAQELDGSLQFDPQTKANQSLASALVSEGESLGQEGKLDEAIADFERAQKSDTSLEISAGSWNLLCRYGSLFGHANQVLEFCEKAVKLSNEQDAWIRNSRGLARALTNDFKGAITDFQFFVQHTGSEEEKKQRQEWIDALEQSKNPFSKKVLKSLRKE